MNKTSWFFSENKTRKGWSVLHFSLSTSKIISIFNVPLLLLEVGSFSCSEASPSSSFCYSVLAQLLIPLRHYSSHLSFLAFPVFSFQLTSSQKLTNVLRSSWPFERLLCLSPSFNLSLLPLPHHPLLPSSLCNLVSAPHFSMETALLISRAASSSPNWMCSWPKGSTKKGEASLSGLCRVLGKDKASGRVYPIVD